MKSRPDWIQGIYFVVEFCIRFFAFEKCWDRLRDPWFLSCNPRPLECSSLLSSIASRFYWLIWRIFNPLWESVGWVANNWNILKQPMKEIAPSQTVLNCGLQKSNTKEALWSNANPWHINEPQVDGWCCYFLGFFSGNPEILPVSQADHRRSQGGPGRHLVSQLVLDLMQRLQVSWALLDRGLRVDQGCPSMAETA